MEGIPVRRRFIPVPLRFGIAAAAVLLGCLIGPIHESSGQAHERGPAPNYALTMMTIPGTDDVQRLIALSSPPAVEMMKGTGHPPQVASGSGSVNQRMDFRSDRARAYISRLESEQRIFADRITALPGARVQARVSLVMNAVVARVPASQYMQVQHLPGVKKVYFSRPRRMLLDTSATLQNAQDLWNKAGGRSRAGSGVKIGIIDTGIDITNPMFIDDSLAPPQGFPKGEAAFTNSKVIVARNYIDLLFAKQTIQTAVDEVGHGTFVAGCAAGRLTNAPLASISGMAPGAFLGSYKVFGTPGINDTTSTAAIVAAIDAAVADGMDVLNLSLGSPDNVPPDEQPEDIALEKAVEAGVIAVVSAGNNGPLTHTIESPGATPDAITVGSVTNSRTFASQVHTTAPAPVPENLLNLPYLPGDGPAINASIPPSPIADVALLDGTGQACGQLPADSLKGSIALVLRKPCTFASKVTNAAAAGAIGVIVYNNNPAEGPVSMAGLGATTIPAVMISNSDGVALKQFVDSNPGSVRVAIDSVQTLSSTPTRPRVLSSFSSVGPGTDFGIKPDLVAVGEFVYSAAQSSNPQGAIFNPTGFTVSSGTSYSSPMVAGAAAALKQLFPQLAVLDIKSALTSTASPSATADGTHAAGILQTGSGFLDMGSAASVTALFSPTSLSFGAHSYAGTLSLSRTLTIKNISSTPDEFELSVRPLIPGPEITLSRNSTGVIPPGGSAGVDITVRVNSPDSGGFQGFVAIESSATGAEYRVPYWAGLYVPDPSRTLTVAQNSSGPDSFSNLTDALSAALPGNTIEIADSGTYPTPLTLSTNAEGLPLDGITIRAATGQTPVLDGSTSIGTIAAVQILGLTNVLLQGLTVKGGTIGIMLSHPSASVPLSVTVDRCVLADNSGTGILLLSGGSLDVTNSVISNPGGAGIVALGGELTLIRSSVEGSAGDGIDTVGTNVDIFDSIVTGGTGPGLNLFGSTGTIDGNTFSLNKGSTGDAVDVVDGTITLTNNTLDSNEGAGIAFLAANSTSPGPSARVSGNTVLRNRSGGILADSGRSLKIDGNLIKDNGSGIRVAGSATALLTNNIIVRSTDPVAGNGIEAADSSSVRAVNNTVFNNSHYGVVLSGKATLSVVNSIISSNGTADVQGAGQGDIQFSLIGDGSLPGNNNIGGNPEFTDPAGDDYTLTPGSPALEAGTNNAAGLPFLDFSRRFRVSSGTSGPGRSDDGRVDLGALEAGSSYPLIFPLIANGNQPILGGPLVTGIAVLNEGTSSGTAGFAGYSTSGAMLSAADPATKILPALSQVPVLDYQLFGLDIGATVLGSILASSTQPLAGFLLLFDAGFQHFATGVTASDRAAEEMVFMRHQSDPSGNTTYCLFNPGVNPAAVTATLYSATGSMVGTPKNLSVGPKGQLLFGFGGSVQSSGIVRVISDRPLSGLEVFGDSQTLSALGAYHPGSEARLFFPHIAENQGFSSTIGIVNPTAFPADVTLSAYRDDGSTMGAPVAVTLAPDSQLLRTVTDLFGSETGTLLTGYVVAQSDQAGIGGFTTFGHDDGSRRSATTLPATPTPQTLLVFSHVAHQVPASGGQTYQTGLALLNPFGAPVDYTLKVFDGTGALVAQSSQTLAPHQKLTRYLSHPAAGAGFFPQPLRLASGHIEVSSDYGLLGLELFFTEDFSQLAGVSPQPPVAATQPK